MMIDRGRAAVFAAAVASAGCGSVQPGAVAPGTGVTAQAQRESSSGALLYVNDGGVDYSGAYILVYTYPQGKHVATIGGFHRLIGACSDSKGDVFVVAPGEELSDPTTIYEYAHGGTEPIATLSETGEGFGCAIDPATGNLAVANPDDEGNPYKSGYGSVAVFAGAQGQPTMYYSEKLLSFFYCGYDNEGSLYLSVGQTGGYGLASLNAGSSSLEPVSLKTPLYGAMYFVPSVQWDGKEMTVTSTLHQGGVGDENSGPIKVYRLSIAGQKARAVGATTLDAEQERHRGQSWITGKTIVGINYEHGWPYVSFWNYPKGGMPRL